MKKACAYNQAVTVNKIMIKIFIFNIKTEDVFEIAKAISKMPKLNDKKRTVIITQAADPVICAIGSFISL